MNDEGRILLGAVFDEFVKHGAQMFVGMRLAPTEEEHAVAYYGFMVPKPEAIIVDLGCGIGGCGYYLQQIDPSLRIINVVNEPALIAYMQQAGRECVEASYEKTGLPDAIADNVMFNESIGYGDLDAVLAEASRLLKPGGTLTIKDFSPLDQTKEEVEFDEWDYRSKRPDLVLAAAYKQGLHVEIVCHSHAYMDHWDTLMGDNPDVKRVLGDDPKLLPICQTLYKFVKGNLRGRA
jgi:SAM-dependent methyltransferase